MSLGTNFVDEPILRGNSAGFAAAWLTFTGKIICGLMDGLQ